MEQTEFPQVRQLPDILWLCIDFAHMWLQQLLQESTTFAYSFYTIQLNGRISVDFQAGYTNGLNCL